MAGRGWREWAERAGKPVVHYGSANAFRQRLVLERLSRIEDVLAASRGLKLPMR